MRLLIAIGVSCFAVSCFMNARMTNETGIDQLRWSQLVRALGQPYKKALKRNNVPQEMFFSLFTILVGLLLLLGSNFVAVAPNLFD
jgi:hypothetical protein